MTDWLQHDRLHHETSAIPHRQPLIWPNDARLALSVMISIEYYEMQPAKGSFIPPNLTGPKTLFLTALSPPHFGYCRQAQEQYLLRQHPQAM